MYDLAIHGGTLVDGSGRGVDAEVAHWNLTLGARFYVRLPQARGGGEL